MRESAQAVAPPVVAGAPAAAEGRVASPSMKRALTHRCPLPPGLLAERIRSGAEKRLVRRSRLKRYR